MEAPSVVSRTSPAGPPRPDPSLRPSSLRPPARRADAVPARPPAPASARRERSCLRGVLLAALLLVAGVAAAQSGRLEPGDARLDSGEFYDVLLHEGRAGETWTVSVASTEFDPYLIVLGPGGEELLQEDDSPGQGLNVRVELVLPADGSYAVAVTSALPGETGAYTLMLESTSAPAVPGGPDAPPPDAANPLSPGAADAPAEPAPAEEPGPPRREPVLPPQEATPPAGGPTPAPPQPAEALGDARFFFVPQDDEGAHNVAKPRIEADATGTVHMAVPGYAGGDAYYLSCPADCRDPAQLSTVTLQTDGTSYNAMIALDADGVPQVLIGAYGAVYYATCAGDCRTREAWTVTRIVQHDPNDDREVTGEAFALDPQGRPRFVMHAYRAFLGVGQPTPVTTYVACDADCHEPASWRQSRISEQIWQESTLRFGADGRAHLATVASAEPGDIGGYMTCAVDCESGRDDAWTGLGLTFAFSDRNVERIDPAITLALTRDGRPRVMLLGRDESGARDLSFWACDAEDCTVEANWTANYLIGSEDLGAGLDLTLDPQDRPRAVYNADDNVFLLVCDGDCLQDDEEGWTLLPVELAGDIPVDEVIPFFNCNVAAWLLRYPSLALGPDGLPRVAYVAEDASGVLGRQDPLHAECTPGVDMAVGRFARLAGLEPPP